jgi:hypothetical protein
MGPDHQGNGSEGRLSELGRGAAAADVKHRKRLALSDQASLLFSRLHGKRCMFVLRGLAILEKNFRYGHRSVYFSGRPSL